MARHRWVKPKLHTYICQKCGTGRVNAQVEGGWQTTYHLPDGTSHVSTRVPNCQPGPLTEKYLQKYAAAIACADTKERTKAA